MGDLLMFRYFQVLSTIPDSLFGVGRRAPVLLRFEGWIAKMALLFKFLPLAPGVNAALFAIGIGTERNLDKSLSLVGWAVASFLIAYALCIWLIYRLSKRVSDGEFQWCESIYAPLGMPEPFRHMNRYILASYVDRAMTSESPVAPERCLKNQSWLSKRMQTARKVVSFKVLSRVVYSNFVVMCFGFLCLPYVGETKMNLVLLCVGGYTLVALFVVVAGALTLTRKPKG